jgi:hypothetical protein
VALRTGLATGVPFTISAPQLANAVVQGAIRASIQRPLRRLRVRLLTSGPPPAVMMIRARPSSSWRKPLRVQRYRAVPTTDSASIRYDKPNRCLDLGNLDPVR